MNLKRTALPLLAVIIGVVAMGGMVHAEPIPDQIWTGTGSGFVVVGDNDTVDVFAYWRMDFYSYNDSLYSVDGYWWDDHDHTGDIWGYVHKTTGAGSGSFDIDQTNPQLTGTWSGTFNYNTEWCSGTWSCALGNGNWLGTRSYP